MTPTERQLIRDAMRTNRIGWNEAVKRLAIASEFADKEYWTVNRLKQVQELKKELETIRNKKRRR
jgi:hypothetical protein